MGQKQKTEKKKRKLKVGNNNDQLRIANTTSGGTLKAALAKKEKDKLGLSCAKLRTSLVKLC